MPNYKYCLVPKCTNTSISTPEKLFFNVPKDPKVRKKWCTIMKRVDKIPLSCKASRFCCEDHFDVEADMENYVKYKLIGGMIKLKNGVLPHKFGCQKPQKNIAERPGVRRRKDKEYFKRVLSKNVENENLMPDPIELMKLEDDSTNDPLSIPENVNVCGQPAAAMAEDGVAWSKSACIALVERYRQHRELWDKTHRLFRAQHAKFAAWTALADTFSCHIQDIRKKLESIMASYRSQRSKVKDGGGSSWFLYPYLSFLPSYVQPQDEFASVSLSSPKSDATTYVSGAEDVEDEEVICKVEKEPEVTKEPYHDKKRLSRTLKRRIVVRNPTQNTNVNKTYIDKKILEVKQMILRGPSSAKDDCDSFGEYIASTLKKYDSKTQCLMKRSINNILFEQEMSKYEYVIVGPNSEDVVLDHSINID